MNSARRPLVCGNWKMFHGGRSSVELAGGVAAFAKEMPKVDIVVAPPFTALAAVAETLDGSPVGLAAQNLYPKDSGAFTGEISGPFLKECGVSWVIIGHSERREHFGESNSFVAEKTAAALAAGLTPIVCVGETLAQRTARETLLIVKMQLDSFLDVIAQAKTPAVIAYEPVWAIGTGKTAGPAEAEEVHHALRTWITGKDEALGQKTRLLYGGSVKPENAAALLACPNVDGALVGGACLDAKQFSAIARAAAPS